MTVIQEFIEGMIGLAPEGWEWLAYVLSGLVMMSALQMLFNLFGDIGRLVSGRR